MSLFNQLELAMEENLVSCTLQLREIFDIGKNVTIGDTEGF